MSGIYIKGISMPEFGERILILCSTGYVEDASGQVIQGVECIPVPHHGRLGDLDALAAKDNDDFLKIMETADPATVLSMALSDTHVAIQEFLKAAPTVIPADKE